MLILSSSRSNLTISKINLCEMNGFSKKRFFPLLLIWLVIAQGCEKEKESKYPIDIDGNQYDTVVIGTQTWLKENLKTTKYRNGDHINLITDNTKWSTFPIGAFCWYDNNADNKEIYGALYNWKAASSDLLCPYGWHVPTSAEWKELIAYLGGQHDAGGKLKETGTIHWISESEGTTNETGFTALPGGCRYLDGTFKEIKQYGNWWMSDYDNFVYIYYSNEYISEGSWNGNPGFSVRCVKNK